MNHFFFILGMAGLFVFTGCEGGRKVENVVITEDDYFLVKHEYQSKSSDGWKLESWHLGTRAPVSYPLDVWLRLTPEKKTDSFPKVKVHLEISLNGKVVRKGDFEPEFQNCAKIKKRKETVFQPGLEGPVTRFPPKEPCWETSVKDPFKSDRRYPNTASFQPGDYLISGELSIEKGPQFKIEPMKVKLYSGRQ